jgi:hypothetical protein
LFGFQPLNIEGDNIKNGEVMLFLVETVSGTGTEEQGQNRIKSALGSILRSLFLAQLFKNACKLPEPNSE